VVLAAQAGDQMAFETLVGAYRHELLVHCYRMLGSPLAPRSPTHSPQSPWSPRISHYVGTAPRNIVIIEVQGTLGNNGATGSPDD